ncbi:MAG: glycosyltransferase family 25 protein [Chitinophagaceae bacterium]|jgi:GR25 family glycosyltransferase involved in LPS biosynthesis|nr:glycosyltransferase family 25 protein [Chitinophagaceae bacterium]
MTHPLNTFFDKVFIISIKRNEQRLQSFLQQNPDLKVEIFDGVDGRMLFPEIDQVFKFPLYFFEQNKLSYERCKRWNKGQLGCAMSNLFLQKKIVSEQIGKALIMEDDAFIKTESLLFFQKALLELPKDWDLFYMGYNPPSRWSENLFTRQLLRIKHFIKPAFSEGLSSGALGKRYFSESFSSHLNKPGIYGGTHGYALSYEGAKKILTIDTPLQFGFDTTLMYANYHKLLNSYSLKKPLIIPNSDFVTSLIN